MAGGDIGTAHIFAWVEGGESGGRRWWVDCRARLIIWFAEDGTTSRKSRGDSSGVHSLAVWVEVGVEEATGRRQLAEGPYLRLPRRGCKSWGYDSGGAHCFTG